jgi:NifU-like protein
MSDNIEKNEPVNIDFSKLTREERIKIVDDVLDDKVRHMLAMDGGNMEIVDIKENDSSYEIYVRYLGACDGCASGSTGTLYAIESILTDEIDENIRVIPL